MPVDKEVVLVDSTDSGKNGNGHYRPNKISKINSSQDIYNQSSSNSTPFNSHGTTPLPFNGDGGGGGGGRIGSSAAVNRLLSAEGLPLPSSVSSSSESEVESESESGELGSGSGFSEKGVRSENSRGRSVSSSAENRNHDEDGGESDSKSGSGSVSGSGSESALSNSDEDSELEELHFDQEDSNLSDSKSKDDDDNNNNNNNNEITGDFVSKETTSLARSYLKANGSMKFLDRYLPGTASAEDILNLIQLLGYKPKELPRSLLFNEKKLKKNNERSDEDKEEEDEDFNQVDNENALMYLIKFLQKAMNKVLTMRVRLPDFDTIEALVDSINNASNIVVLTGAGISTSLGIPDFRSSKGFYAKLSYLGLEDPQEVFDLSYFREDPAIFYSIAHMILPPEHAFTPLHGFIRLLQDKGKLLRNYTQNIDNLESNVGIDADKLIQCHGSFATATCITCGFKVPGETIFKEIRAQEVPICPWCKTKRFKLLKEIELEEDLNGSASAWKTMFSKSFGVMKPDITFFGEALPERFHTSIKKDISECDLLICIGTSLKVAPVSEIVNMIPEEVPQVLINKDLVGHCEFDLSLLGYCDQVIVYLSEKLGWKINHKDFEKIAKSDLKCTAVEEKVGIYEITSSNYNEEELNEKSDIIGEIEEKEEE